MTTWLPIPLRTRHVDHLVTNDEMVTTKLDLAVSPPTTTATHRGSFFAHSQVKWIFESGGTAERKSITWSPTDELGTVTRFATRAKGPISSSRPAIVVTLSPIG
jgi:hypothetical protein